MGTIYARGMPGAKTPAQAKQYFKNYNKSKGIKTVNRIVGVSKKSGTYYVAFTEKKRARPTGFQLLSLSGRRI